MLRVHQLLMVIWTGARLPVKHPAFAKQVEHVSDILNHFLFGNDGKTPVQSMIRKSCEQYVSDFGSPVMLRAQLQREPGSYS